MKTVLLVVSTLFLLAGSWPAEGKEQWYQFLTGANNPSREAALTEQESSWQVFAESPYAKGLRQFTKDTASWLELGMCSHLGPADVFDPEWALKCGIVYAEYLEKLPFGGYCNTRKIAEMRYNGGFWIVWELREANTINIEEAKPYCGTRLSNGRKRSERSCRENYEYPGKIGKRQLSYANLGGTLC